MMVNVVLMHDYMNAKTGERLNLSFGSFPPMTRVEIKPDGTVNVLPIDIDGSEQNYPDLNSLPRNLQDAVAVLMMQSYSEAGHVVDVVEVPNVGRRMAKNVFWIWGDK